VVEVAVMVEVVVVLMVTKVVVMIQGLNNHLLGTYCMSAVNYISLLLSRFFHFLL
jgi:hypothetical protein